MRIAARAVVPLDMHDAASGDLFGPPEGGAAPPEVDPGAPLAERMRPRQIDEVLGQDHLVGEGRLLHQLVESGHPTSLIFWGPAGVGKTTLARIVAAAVGSQLVELSATASGVKQLREAAAQASRLREHSGHRTVLFIDEIHRFHKGQQDALLPWVEDGSIVLIGATTENPSFEVVPPLLSRCRVVRLAALDPEHLEQLLQRALDTPPPRGLGASTIEFPSPLLRQIATLVDGDARAALSALELTVSLVRQRGGEPLLATETDVKEALQRPHLRYDQEEHFNQISALQKSIRNSDPDAALYWLARMLEAGEAPLYVARRLVRMASEDVGLADPAALPLAVAGMQTMHAIGMPEGALALAEVAVYLAAAPKSNSVSTAYSAAIEETRASGSLPVPMQLRNAPTRLMKEEGYGAGYIYAHDLDDGIAAMDCLPEEIRDRIFYVAAKRGAEVEIAERLRAADLGRRTGRPTDFESDEP